MAFASPGRAEQQKIGAPCEPAITSGERHHLRLADHRYRLEVKVGECLTGRQSCFRQMTFDATTTAIGDLMFGECGQKAGGWPTLLVGLLSELSPHQLHGGQA